jgi:putative nucleotidyltransferase with HDIG domain
MILEIQISDQNLPVLSAVASQAMTLLNDPDINAKKIDDLIRQDPSLTQRLLHVANSPFYSGRFQAQSISDAVVRLGMRQLRNVILVAASGELFSEDDPHIKNFWEHAIATALASNILAEELRTAQTEEAFIAGMFHDVGKVIIYSQHPEPYAETMSEAQEAESRLFAIEDEKFRYFSHMTVGGLTIRKWKLADSIAETTHFHHVVESEISNKLINPNLTCIVSLASVLVNNLNLSGADDPKIDVEPLACARHLNFPISKLDNIGERITEVFSAQRGAMF